MLTKYIQAAMRRAKYEIVEDDGSFFGHIPELQGVWANASTLEGCREQLAEVVEVWITYRLAKHLAIPEIEGVSIDVGQPA